MIKKFEPTEYGDVVFDYPAMARSMMLYIPKELQDEKMPLTNMLAESVRHMAFIIEQQRELIEHYKQITTL